MVVLGLIDNVRGPFFPEILQDLQLDAAIGSLFFAVSSFFAAVLSTFGARIPGIRSAEQLLIYGCWAMAVGFAWIGLAPVFAWTIVGCVFLGASIGAISVAQNILVYESAVGEKRRRLYSGLHSLYGLSALGAPLVASVMRGLGFDWRTSFVCMGLLPLVVIGLAWHKGRGEHQIHPSENGGALTKTDRRVAWFYAFLLSLYIWGELSLSTRLVQWLRMNHGMAPDQANLLLAVFFATLLVGRLSFGLFALSRWNNWWVMNLCALGAAMSYLATLHVSPWAVAVLGLTLAPFYPAMMDQVAHRFHRKSSHALSIVIGFSSMSVVGMHITLGWINNQFGLTLALDTCALALIVLALILAARRFWPPPIFDVRLTH